MGGSANEDDPSIQTHLPQTLLLLPPSKRPSPILEHPHCPLRLLRFPTNKQDKLQQQHQLFIIFSSG